MIKAGAVIIGDPKGSGSAVYNVAAKIGFEFVKPYANRPTLPLLVQGTPLSFILFAEVADPGVYEPLIREIRQSSSRALAFAPMAYFCESISRDIMDICVGAGFDDVISMPFMPERVRAQLMQQIEAPQVYFETSDYFGPDRRRLSAPRLADAFLRGLPLLQSARRIEIRRSLTTGVAILRDETIDGQGKAIA